jgi:hypothetical protein
MNIFGEKGVFAIEYELVTHPYGDEEGLLGDSWGYARFWLKGKDLFEFKVFRGKGLRLYNWSLCYLVGWFCENIAYLLEDSEFQMKDEGETALEIMRNLRETEVDYDSDAYDELCDKRYNLFQKHCIFSAANGSFLPILYLRGKDNVIEVSWDTSEGYEDGAILYSNTKGLDSIDRKVFFEAVYSFVTHFINRFKNIYPEQINEYAKFLDDSLKKIPSYH